MTPKLGCRSDDKFYFAKLSNRKAICEAKVCLTGEGYTVNVPWEVEKSKTPPGDAELLSLQQSATVIESPA